MDRLTAKPSQAKPSCLDFYRLLREVSACLQIDVEEAGTAETDRVLVERRVEAAMKENGRLQVVPDRGLKIGDVALVDFEARSAASGEPIAGSKAEKVYKLTLGNESIQLAFQVCPFYSNGFCIWHSAIASPGAGQN